MTFENFCFRMSYNHVPAKYFMELKISKLVFTSLLFHFDGDKDHIALLALLRLLVLSHMRRHTAGADHFLTYLTCLHFMTLNMSMKYLNKLMTDWAFRFAFYMCSYMIYDVHPLIREKRTVVTQIPELANLAMKCFSMLFELCHCGESSVTFLAWQRRISQNVIGHQMFLKLASIFDFFSTEIANKCAH